MNRSLLERYFKGNVTDRERCKVAEWVAKSQDNLNEYMAAHPEILAGKRNIQFHRSAPDQKQLESTVRRLVTELLGSGVIAAGAAQDAPPPAAQQVSDDILDMLTDLDMFG